jgi:chitodextrinase
VFNVTGNHGFTNGAVQVVNWPEGNAASSSNGRYLMESYPSINGSTASTYPSFWYAFDAGPARFYVLTASWADGNVGTGSVYANDAAAHWTPSSAEYQWLENDLATHSRSLKFAFWHYPLYADSSGQPSDTSLQGGPGTLQGLLNANNVNIAFNGHAHGYERNHPDPAGLVSYVFGNGGAALGRVSGCSAFDAYAIGSSGSHCGLAPAGLTDDRVFGFAKVTVNGQQVTVTPTDELGRTYDVQTFTFPSGPDTQAPSAPGTPTVTDVTSSTVALSWAASTDNVGVTGYRVFRDGAQVGSTGGSTTTFQDTGLAASTTYSYTIQAVDAAGNPSPQSGARSATTTAGGSGTTLTFAATDDATIDASTPTTALGTGNRITVDSSPANDMLLKFTVTGTGTGNCPTISAAKLRLTVGNTSNDNAPKGGDFRAAVNSNWSESNVTYNTAPAAAAGSPVASISTPVALGTPYLVDITPLVTGDGTITIRASGNSSDGARYYSRNGNAATLAPELQVTCG